MNDFIQNVVKFTGKNSLDSQDLTTIQINLGLRCNMSCHHCHVAASPSRREEMSFSSMEEVLNLIDKTQCQLVDLTGGAPELNPHFKTFIEELKKRNLKIQVRTNLTIYLEKEQKELPKFLRDHHVGLVGSMPCYLQKNVDTQRGEGSYQQSIQAIRLLNGLGYGGPSHSLDLVYNPGGPFLPPKQNTLELDYRKTLKNQHDIVFNRLLTITNMPIGRFRAHLRRQGDEAAYWSLLYNAFNPGTLDGLMCRNQISIGWDGTLYDCDFNLALGWPIRLSSGETAHIKTCHPEQLSHRSIITGNHCLACTAGCGSSCAGALVA